MPPAAVQMAVGLALFGLAFSADLSANASVSPGLRGGSGAGSSTRAGRLLQGDTEKTSCGNGYYQGGDAADDDVWPGDGALLPPPQGHYPGNYEGRLAELSTTPFPVKRDSHPAPATDSYCKDADVAWYAGSAGGAKAWIDETQAEDDGKNYFVFHGCDGAGLQMGDCLGDVKYVEQFGPRCEWGVDPGCDTSACTDWHKPCPFRHPGTGVGYRWYNCGWWSWGNDWVDESKPWFPYTGIANPPNSEGTALLYPWVCGSTGKDWSWYWGGDSYHHGGGAADTMPGNWKCYCDNEPNDNSPGAHFHSHIPPPTIFAYRLWKDGGHIKAESAHGSSSVFELSGQQYPPW